MMHTPTVELLRAENARLCRDLDAAQRAVSERDVELAHARPVADAAHAYCTELERPWLSGPDDLSDRHAELVAAHRATTPSSVPSSHVIVDRAELKRLRAIEKAVRRVAHVAPDEAPEAWHDVLVLLGEES